MPDANPPLSSVRDLKALENAGGQPFASLLVVRKLAAKTASNGNPFLSVDLGDRTGTFGCTVFNDNPAFELLRNAGEGAVVRVEGKIDYYQNRLSPKLNRLSVLSEAELGAPGLLDNLVELAPENAEALWAEFNGFVDGITHAELRATTRAVFDEIG
jgi:3'-5' exoribonuclease